jgi:hypothetical protein
MAKYRVTTDYDDGTKRMMETTDGKKAMQEAAGCSYQEETGKTVMLQMDDETIWKEKVKPWKADQVASEE